MTATDLGETTGRAEAQILLPLAAEQTTLLPPSPSDWRSDDHQVSVLPDLVDELDLSQVLIPAKAKDLRGVPPISWTPIRGSQG